MSTEFNMKDNKLIAEFMGVKKIDHGWIAIEGRAYAYNAKIYPNSLQYHKSWTWLMPVVEKIESLKHPVSIIELTCEISNTINDPYNKDPIYIDEPAMTKIETVYEAVVEFINWYNINR